MKKEIYAFTAALLITFTGCANTHTTTDNDTENVTEIVSETVASEAETINDNDADEAAIVDDTIADVTDGLIYDAADNTWSTDDEELKKLADIVKESCAKSSDIKGTYILATDDKVLFIGGMNGIDKDGNKVDAYTTYEIGSLTKMITATAVFQLAEQGKLSVDDTLDKYFPEYENSRKIKIYDLLHMRSGLLRDFFPEENFEDQEFDAKFYSDGFTDEELLESLFGAELSFEPGTKYDYSNSNYTLLAMIIEKVTGLGYDEYIQENIFDVCRMEHSSSMKTGDITSVPELILSNTSPMYLECPRNARGAGDIHSCCADMLAFDRALIGGKLINEESLAMMFDMNRKNMNDCYGCGWEAHPNYPTNENIYWHSGCTISYISSNLYCKNEKYGNIYMIQLHSNYSESEYRRGVSCEYDVIWELKK